MCVTCGSPSHRLVYNKGGVQIDRYDPTNTGVIVGAMEAEIARRFEELKSVVWQTIVGDNALGLSVNITSAGTARWAFGRSDAKAAGFMQWLLGAASEGILGIKYGTPIASAASTSWSRIYIDAAYHSGMQQSASRLVAAGAKVAETWIDGAFRRPIHAEASALVYTRTYESLQNVTEVMADQMREVLTNGMAQGWGMEKIAAALVDRVDKIGVTRSRTIARTEIIAAHAESTLNSYEEARIEGVEVEAEWTATMDNVVCPYCRDMQGRRYSISEARGMIPAHPNCRCAFLPAIGDAAGIELN